MPELSPTFETAGTRLSSTVDPRELEKRIYREIPIASYMRVRVEEASRSRVQLNAPLAPNINHKKTAFGGSIHSLAVLSCWTLVTVTLMELEKEDLFSDYVVVQDSQIDYAAPIATDFSAVAQWSTGADRETFLNMLRKKGLARATLKAEVITHAGICATLEARFAARVETRHTT